MSENSIPENTLSEKKPKKSSDKNFNIVQVAVPTPLRRKFDYLLSDEINPQHVMPGMRVLVPFGRTKQIAVVLGLSEHTDIEIKKLRPISKILDKKPVFPATIIKLLNWVAAYYHHPIGEVYQTALPVHYRKKESAPEPGVTLWFLTEQGKNADWDLLKRAVRQRSILEQLKCSPEGLSKAQIASKQEGQWQSALKVLVEKNWLATKVQENSIKNYEADHDICRNPGLQLNAEQQVTVTALLGHDARYHASLIDGITGSGKTEVYLSFIEQQLKNTRQVLVLVPEIGLTPQLIHRFEHRFSVKIQTLHSGLNNTQRMKIWQQVSSGEVRILIGTRSAVFTPMPDLGAIIIDEEHDLSFKQQDGIRYSARDIALVRANYANIPIILGSATPSMESLYLCQTGKMSHHKLRQRAGKAKPPEVHLIDVRGQYLQHGISRILIDLIHQHLDKNNQVLLFQNRRGYSPVLLCNKCGWIGHCHRCDAKLTYHQQQNRLRCHHCQTEQSLPTQCPECGHSELSHLGIGTERVEKTIRALFPEIEVIRIDRDTTQRKGALQTMLEQARDGQKQILIGTQMLAKGHHFPNVTLVAILDIDQGLYSIDFRAPERLAQLIIQVSGRAGREEKKGQVVLQTSHPEDEILNTLLNEGYTGFAEKTLAERKEILLPPYAYQALIRAEGNKTEYYQSFLEYCFQTMSSSQQYLPAGHDVQFLGPVSAPMEKKAGKFRGQLLVQASSRKNLHNILNDLIKTIDATKAAQRVRWSIDIDPQELY
ncbi:MAG: primosomal protein N' [gamma proteobacterium symbiont of Bathyaustriella thionipta]|nr:primosomal protein N' [gamma proteobacterium symbiont of Bathyaustriella thionipta]MCU7951194.1 primosomal protein N' [gamma proteobacterium symbiont of Bathyaustriella thionipta]MCU7952371.1 primosomal protein N' [gamma proteobacterium symbiont of Bathyaustriella thionipta]MCU7957701.1 primosomal protein N' [gamma proteobacterium symbiont of Bathyaustriella thionipta]MCU7967975.1 primosomal protein N' [gamma proteobacterium symbiont of Bathyaustriella thionipta]